MDTLTKEKRSWNMARIKSKDTGPELTVRKFLHRSGYRFRLHRKDLPGNPDIVLPKYKIAIFVHGCFWHRHVDCRFAYFPKSRTEFWNNKFLKNINRDNKVKHELEQLGWSVFVIWECETKSRDKLIDKLNKFHLHKQIKQ